MAIKKIGPNVYITKDLLTARVTALVQLAGKQVLIGFPDSGKARQDPKEPTNAQIAYVQDQGSPAANIPARPFMTPGVTKSLPVAEPLLKLAAEATLDGERAKAMRYLNAAGIAASSSVKNEIRTGNFVPLSPSTVAGRYRQRQTKTRRATEIAYSQMIRMGVSPAAAQAATGIKPLLNTTQLLNAVTYVIRTVK